MADSRPNVLVIVPCFNEAASLPGLLQDLKRTSRELSSSYVIDIVVVDDGSTDASAELARHQSVAVLRHLANLGIGCAVQTGIKFAVRNNYAFAIQVDGDGQHPPEHVKDLLLAGQRSPAPDLVVGSRFVDRDGYQSTALRRLGIVWLSTLLATFAGLKVTDPTSGFRLFGKRALCLFEQQYPYDYPEPESLAFARRAQLRIVEVAVKMKDRQGGRSSLKGINGPYYMVKVSLAIVLAVFRKGAVQRSTKVTTNG